MIRLNDLQAFLPLEGLPDAAKFANTEARVVRLQVNTPEQTALYWHGLDPSGAIPENSEGVLVCSVIGLHDVEFFTPGAFALVHTGECVWLHCKDGDNPAIEIVDAETYTMLYERRPRNPEIEALQEVLLRNQERRMKAMYDDLDREHAKLRAEREALDQRAGAPGGNSPAPEPGNGTGESASGAGTPPGGEEGGGVDA